MNRVHFSLKLRTDRPRTDGTVGIYLYANINGKLSWYSTNKAIKPNCWNKKKQEVKSSCPDWSTINSHISIYLKRANDFVTQCNLDNQIANRQMLDHILRSVKHQTNSYYKFVDQYIIDYSKNYSYNTLRGFRSHIRKLKEYKTNLEFENIDKVFWRNYETHQNGNGCKPSTIHKQYRLFKKFLNKAVEFGIIKEDLLIGLKVKNNEGNRQFLSLTEVQELHQLYKSKKISSKGYSEVLRYFLFACYTSLRYADVKKLKFKNIINGESINQIMDKTGKLINIPLSNKAKSLLGKQTVPNDRVFKVFTNQVTNRYLKEIIKQAEIQKEISFHCARHTWATITLELTGNVALVSNVLGHSSIKTTQIYAKVLEKSKREAMEKWDNI